MELEGVLGFLSRSTIALSGLSVVAGVVFIRLGESGRHRAAMLTAAAFAVIFLILYIIKSSLFPFKPYRGAYRALFHFILWSHTLLSLVNLPLAVVTIYLALKKRFERHRRIAPYTAGLWIYVAGSGWLVFLLNG